MTCWIEVDDVFVWQDDHKMAREGDTAVIDRIRVDEDGVAWVDIINCMNRTEKVAAEDVQEKVEEGLLEKQ